MAKLSQEVIQSRIGLKFNRLTIISYSEAGKFLCSCDCGNQKILHFYYVENGIVKGCGCLKGKNKSLSPRSAIYRKWFLFPEYAVHASFKARCYNPKNKSYKNYGGRGIIVCDRWLESFLNFYEDMGPRPSKKHTLDRIDNNGPYSPENCRWATWDIQSTNKRNNVLITFKGETMPLSEWATKTGLSRTTLAYRVKSGWTIEKILTQPSKNKKSPPLRA